MAADSFNRCHFVFTGRGRKPVFQTQWAISPLKMRNLLLASFCCSSDHQNFCWWHLSTAIRIVSVILEPGPRRMHLQNIAQEAKFSLQTAFSRIWHRRKWNKRIPPGAARNVQNDNEMATTHRSHIGIRLHVSPVSKKKRHSSYTQESLHPESRLAWPTTSCPRYYKNIFHRKCSVQCHRTCARREKHEQELLHTDEQW